MLRFITRHVFTGLVTIVPVLLTIYLIYWFITSTETVLGNLIRFLLPNLNYWPGMGVFMALVLVFLIGLLMHIYVVQRLFEKAEQLLYHTPLIKSVYGAIRDFFQYFSSSKEKDFQQVVSVQFDDVELIGFITQNDSDALPAGLGSEEKILVYLPMSYMIGGYAILVSREKVKTLDMKMEEAMRFCLTAGVATNSQVDSNRQKRH